MSSSELIKDEFLNATAGYVGVVVIEGSKERGVAVRPGETIWLSEAEQIRTANAPRKDEDNPFINGSLKLVTKGAEVPTRRPIGANQTDEEQEEAARLLREQHEREAAEKKVAAEAEAKRKAAAENAPPPSPMSTGAPAPPANPPATGQTAPNEEVATPAAPAAKKAPAPPPAPSKTGGKSDAPAPPPPPKKG